MKVLIAYASKSGTTKKCALEIASKIPHATVLDLNSDEISLEEYDVIIIGTSVRMALIQKSARNFIQKNWEILSQKHVACFFCNAFLEQEAQIIEHNFSKEFIDHVFYLKSFGGNLDQDKLTGFDKILTNLVNSSLRGKTLGSVVILEDRIQELTNAILGI